MRDVKYPDVHVKLAGEDGNAFAILGRVQRELQRAGVPVEERNAYYNEATSGDYDNLLAVTCRWVDVS
jgi:hypothetical protein